MSYLDSRFCRWLQSASSSPSASADAAHSDPVCRRVDRSVAVPNAVAPLPVTPSPSVTHILEWLAIALTPGMGPTRSRKLVEHFGGADAVFRASLTELESTGI